MKRNFLPKIENYTENNKKINRRNFIKKIGLVGITGVVGVKILDLFLDDKNNEHNKINKNEFVSTKEEERIEIENKESIKNIINYDRKEIKIGPEEIERIKLYWENRYKNNPSMRRGFEESYFKIGAWDSLLKDIFYKELGKVLPKDKAEDLVYLSIPESDWKLKAVSNKGAVGPYQIIRSTARKYGLKMNDVIDERIDPEMSASACARIIKDLLRDFNGNFDLAISGYNGSFVYEYKRSNIGKELSYDGFLKYTEGKINRIKNDLENKKFLTHIVRHDDTLYKIAKVSGVPIEELLSINNIKDASKIYYKQPIKIPLNDYIKREIFNEKTNGLKENIVYPAKYNAVIDLINEGVVKKQEKQLHFKIIEIKTLIHKMKKDDTLYSLAREYNLGLNELISANPGIKASFIPLGYNLKIPINSTLDKISRERGENLHKLKILNPSIKNVYANLPNGFKVRV